MAFPRIGRPALAALAAASIFTAGCGGSEEDDVKDAVRDIATAAKDKDYEGVCDGIAKDTRKTFEAGAGGGCAKQLETIDEGGELSEQFGEPDDIKFDKVTVKDDKATVTIKGDKEPGELVKEDGAWKITIPGS